MKKIIALLILLQQTPVWALDKEQDLVLTDLESRNSASVTYNFIGLGLGYGRRILNAWLLGLNGEFGAIPTLNSDLRFAIAGYSGSIYVQRAFSDARLSLGYSIGYLQNEFSIKLSGDGLGNLQMAYYSALSLDLYFRLGDIWLGPRLIGGQIKYGPGLTEPFFAIQGLRITQIIDW